MPEVRLDLSKVYPAAKKVVRTAQLSEAGLTVRDRIEGLKPGTRVRFQFLTQTGVALDGATATLTKGRKKLTVSASVPVEWRAVPARELMRDCDTPFKPPATRLEFTLKADTDGIVEYEVVFRR